MILSIWGTRREENKDANLIVYTLSECIPNSRKSKFTHFYHSVLRKRKIIKKNKKKTKTNTEIKIKIKTKTKIKKKHPSTYLHIHTHTEVRHLRLKIPGFVRLLPLHATDL